MLKKIIDFINWLVRCFYARMSTEFELHKPIDPFKLKLIKNGQVYYDFNGCRYLKVNSLALWGIEGIGVDDVRRLHADILINRQELRNPRFNDMFLRVFTLSIISGMPPFIVCKYKKINPRKAEIDLLRKLKLSVMAGFGL